jgi:phenylacetate-CoA ligase
VLVGLEGRPPVVFRGAAGQALNNIDVSNALKQFALAQYALHQFADGSLRLRVRGGDTDRVALRETLLGLFGSGQVLAIEESDAFGAAGGKVVQYTRDG